MQWTDTLIIQTERPKLSPELISEILGIPLDQAAKYRHPGTTEYPIIDYVINKYTNNNDIVLDPMCGTGTIVKRSLILGRDAYGLEVVPDYVKLSNAAIRNEVGVDERITLCSAIQIRDTDWPKEKSPIKLVFFSPPLLNINRGSYPDSIDQIGNFKLGEENRWFESIRITCANVRNLFVDKGYLAILWHNQMADGYSLTLTETGVTIICDSGYKLVDEKIVLFQANPSRLPEILHVFQKA